MLVLKYLKIHFDKYLAVNFVHLLIGKLRNINGNTMVKGCSLLRVHHFIQRLQFIDSG